MAQYKQPDITDIYWASNDGFKGGRDPLGIQNSSIATYSILLPGLTNLTSHIRYYSLYCWLLSEYATLKSANATTLHQYNFIRRAELAIALIMKGQNIGAIVGSMFVSQNRCKLIEDGVFDIASGADYESKDKYWTFPSGALGQYYIGSLIYYGLVKIEEKRFDPINNGRALANTIINSVDKNVRDLFIDCIQKGSLTEDNIKDLQPLAINQIPVNSEEWLYLNNLLTQKDKESTFRKETIMLLLTDLSRGVKIQDFVKNRFLKADKETEIQAAFGWYFYFLCESFHYCIDSLFCIILNKIHELHNPPINQLSQSIINTILKEINHKYSSLAEWQKDANENIEITYDKLKDAIKRQDYIHAAVYAISLLLRLNTEFEKNKKAIIDFESKNKLSQPGIFSQGMESYVAKYLSYSISKSIEMLITQIMQEHTMVAIRKMGQNNSDLRKFIFEDGRVVLVEQRYPIETSPRIYSLFNFLQDMSYIDSDGKLTDIAYNFIENYGK